MLLARLIYLFGWFLLALALGHLPPLMVALLAREAATIQAFLVSGALAIFVGGGLIVSLHGMAGQIDRRISFLGPLFGLVCLPLFAAIPFVASGVLPSLLDGYFEAISGLTTTGASLIPDPGAIPASLVFWRAFLQWLGGFGVIIMASAILAYLNVGGMQFFSSALPHGEGEGVMGRLLGATKALLGIYAVLTVVAILMVWAAGAPVFDAVCLALSGISTGGFMPRAGTVGENYGAAVEVALALVMILGALNFAYYWQMSRGRMRRYLRDPEYRFFFSMLLSFWLLVFIVQIVAGAPAEEAGAGWGGTLRMAFVASASAITTSGFLPDGYSSLNLFSSIALLGLAYIGGAAGSTAGGLKIFRMIFLIRHSHRELKRLAHPHGMFPLRYRNRPIRQADLAAVWTLLFVSLGSICVASLVFSAFNVPFRGSIALAIASLSNAGPTAFLMDPSFPGFHTLLGINKLFAIGLMILGRLEMTLVLALFWRAFWRI